MIRPPDKENIKYKLVGFLSEIKKDKGNYLLILFLIAILIISFITPYLYYGRLFGTDDYTHLFHTGKMATATSISSFYDDMIDEVSNTESDINPFYYPFGLWLYDAQIIKMTGLPALDMTMLFVIVFLLLLIGSFYFYSRLFLTTRNQKILAVLFLVSMPNMALMALAYRPSVFAIPFLLIIIYAAFHEPIDIRLIPIMLLSIFIIVISHTGTYIFLISVTITFFFIYCLVWGEFSWSVYLTILSSFVIYVVTLSWFPNISYQYEAKSSFFVTIGNFFASKFNLILASDMGRVFYENLFVGQQLVYAVIFGAIIFTIGWILMNIHQRVAAFFRGSENVFPLTLPIQNISHSLAITPLWIGPVHCVLSVFGVFQLDSKGKCLLISTFACSLLPNIFQTSSGIFAETGALREVNYLIIIIPITSALGFWKVISYFKESTFKHKKAIISVTWIIVLLSTILIPTIATSYYLPKIAGEDYIIDGMKWLGTTNDHNAKVAGYGYRTVPIYTNMTDASYGLQSGSDTRRFAGLLAGIYFSNNEENANNFLREYSARFILISDKILSNFGKTWQNATVDKNYALDKIYASNDYGIYEIGISPQMNVPKMNLTENTTIMSVGTSFEVESPHYKIILNENSPSIERIGTTSRNMLGEGFSTDTIKIAENIQKNTVVNQYAISNLNFTHTIEGNKLTYNTLLKNSEDSSNVCSLMITYEFFPDSIRRDYFISNDWQGTNGSAKKDITLSSFLFTPLSDFMIDTDHGRQTRHIYESQDAIVIDDIINDLYVHDNDVGIYIKFESPFPSSIGYQGSTIYNMSSISFSQGNSIKPSDSLHITQYFSVSDESTAKDSIRNHEGIEMSNYPNGIIPVIFVGYRTPKSDLLDSNYITDGYSVIVQNNIPFTEAVNPLDTRVNTANMSSNSTMEENGGNESGVLTSIDLNSITANGVNIIGLQSTGINAYDDFSTQWDNFNAVVNYADTSDIQLTGFMPTNLDYDLNTIKVILDLQMHFLLAIPVNPPVEGMSSTGFRNPDIAYFNGKPTDMVLLPVSYPISTSMLYSPDPASIFSKWQDVMSQAVANDEMALFLIRSNEIGNPAFADQFVNLTAYAQEEGLTFTTPDVIADHFRKLQKIEYNGIINNDEAMIFITNQNDEIVKNVTFKVTMPALKKGEYQVKNATISRKNTQGSSVWLYVTCDLKPHQSTVIFVNPVQKKEDLFVDIPLQPIEGTLSLTVKDKDGIPIQKADVNVDMKRFTTDKNGIVQIILTRGEHELTVQSPGYNTLHRNLHVKGRVYIIKNIFGNLWP